MAWQSVFPDGTKSVKDNETIGQQNTTYIKTYMNLDHYWDDDGQTDGYHRKTTLKVLDADPSIPAGMDAVLYSKANTNGIPVGFIRNSSGIFQYLPGFLSGTFTVASGYNNIATVPANTYGEILMWKDTTNIAQRGYYVSNANYVEAYAQRQKLNSGSDSYNVELSNTDQATNSLIIRGKRGDGGSGVDGTWQYRIRYWDA